MEDCATDLQFATNGASFYIFIFVLIGWDILLLLNFYINCQETLKADKNKDAPPQAGQAVQATQKAAGKYVPPSLREGGNRRGESMMSNRRGMSHDTCTAIYM